MKKGSLFILRFISILLLAIVSIVLLVILIPVAWFWNVLESVIDKTLAPVKMIDIVKDQISVTDKLLSTE